MIKLAVSGACGKMGSRIIALADEESDFKLAVALEEKGHPGVGKFVSGVKVTDDSSLIKDADCLIEFTSPVATLEHLAYALKYKKPVVIGTTGLSDEDKLKIRDASRKIAVVFSPNMSIGVNLLFRLVRDAAGVLSAQYKTSIIEAHHIHKKDAPSGTAKKLAEIIKDAAGREAGDIESIREGEIVGDHRVIFDSPFDKIELFHSAKTRDIFAQGALVAARFVVRQKAGLYDMQDVLFTRK